MGDAKWSAEWDEWFDKQHELNQRIDRAIVGLSVGKGALFRVALWSSVIEHAAEAMRADIPDAALGTVGQPQEDPSE